MDMYKNIFIAVTGRGCARVAVSPRARNHLRRTLRPLRACAATSNARVVYIIEVLGSRKQYAAGAPPTSKATAAAAESPPPASRQSSVPSFWWTRPVAAAADGQKGVEKKLSYPTYFHLFCNLRNKFWRKSILFYAFWNCLLCVVHNTRVSVNKYVHDKLS